MPTRKRSRWEGSLIKGTGTMKWAVAPMKGRFPSDAVSGRAGTNPKS